VRIAVFTNKFPTEISTFFARDMASLIRAGIEIDVFPFYPLNRELWQYVPDMLGDHVLPRNHVHHIGLSQSLHPIGPLPRNLMPFMWEASAVAASAVRHGLTPLSKTLYVAIKALGWARFCNRHYDHILAYWGNYAASSAYLFRHLTNREVPFSIFLHAGIDLYETPVYMRQKLLSASRIITCSDFNRHYIAQHFEDIFPQIAERVHVHYHGLDLADFSFRPGGRTAGQIVAAGAFHEYKGFEYLLRAGYELTQRGVNYEIVLVGDGPDRKALTALAADLGISDNVRFLGWLPPAEVAEVMRRATLFVHPSSRLADGVPNVIKEAMAVGTPVVGSAVAGIPELLGDGTRGSLVPPRDPSALANAIQELLAGDALRANYARQGRRYIEEKCDVWRNGETLAAVLQSSAPAASVISLAAAHRGVN
jgi:colanic acid/amylovoran biosynthesis glycosyltransferase